MGAWLIGLLKHVWGWLFGLQKHAWDVGATITAMIESGGDTGQMDDNEPPQKKENGRLSERRLPAVDDRRDFGS